MKGDRIISKFMLSSYSFGIMIFVVLYFWALTNNPIFFILALVFLGLMFVAYLRYDSKYDMSRYEGKTLKDWR